MMKRYQTRSMKMMMYKQPVSSNLSRETQWWSNWNLSRNKLIMMICL